MIRKITQKMKVRNLKNKKRGFNQLRFRERIGDYLHLSRSFELTIQLDETQLEKKIQEISSVPVDFADYQATVDHTVHPLIFTINRIRKTAKGELEVHLIGRIVATGELSQTRLMGKAYPNTIIILMSLVVWIMIFLVYDKHILAAIIPGGVALWYIKDSLQVRDKTLNFFKQYITS